MASHILLYGVPGVVAGGGPPPLALSGDFPDHVVLSAYEGRISIDNSIGKCSVDVVESFLPDDATVFVDNLTKEVVIKWGAYDTEEVPVAVPNAGFESGDVQWEKGPGLLITNTGDSFEGDWSLELSPAFYGDTDAVGQLIKCPPERSITASCKVQQGATSSGKAGGQLVLVWYRADRTVISESPGNMVSSGSGGAWNTSTVTATAPALTAFVGVKLHSFRKSQNKPLWMDSCTWNHTVAPGAAPDATFTITLRVRDAANRTVMQSYDIAPYEASLFNEITADGPKIWFRCADLAAPLPTMSEPAPNEVGDDGLYNAGASAGWFTLGEPALYTGGPTCLRLTNSTSGIVAEPELWNESPGETLNEMSIGFIIKPWSMPTPGAYVALLCADDTSAERVWQLRFSATQLELVIIRAGTFTIASTASWAADETSFIHVTMRADGRISFYKNGVLAGFNDLGTRNWGNLTDVITFGYASGPSVGINAYVSEIAMYRHTLSAARIATQVAVAGLTP